MPRILVTGLVTPSQPGTRKIRRDPALSLLGGGVARMMVVDGAQARVPERGGSERMTTAVTEVLADAQEIRLERGRILSALMDDAEAIADRGATAIQREIVAYAQGGDRLFADMREQVLLNYRTKLRLLLE